MEMDTSGVERKMAKATVEGMATVAKKNVMMPKTLRAPHIQERRKVRGVSCCFTLRRKPSGSRQKITASMITRGGKSPRQK